MSSCGMFRSSAAALLAKYRPYSLYTTQARISLFHVEVCDKEVVSFVYTDSPTDRIVPVDHQTS